MELTELQKKEYNTFRGIGMSPEKALALATQDSTNQSNKWYDQGVDGLLFGKKSLASSIGKGLKSAAFSGFETIAEDTRKHGAGFALLKSPLSLAAGVGRGVGDVVGGVLETADDIFFDEAISKSLQPGLERAIGSDTGQYLLERATELNEKGRGIPKDILDSLDLLGITALAKSGVASGIKTSIKNQIKKAPGRITGTTAKAGAGLKEFLPSFKGVTPTSVLDVAVEKGIKAIDVIKKVPAAVATSAKRSVDRRILRTVGESIEKAKQNMLNLYKKGIVPGVKKKGKTITNIKKINEAITKTVPELAAKYYDDFIDGSEDVITSFAEIISTEKRAVFSKLDEGLKASGKAGQVISTKQIVAELDELLLSERAKFSKPLRDAIEKAKAELVDVVDDVEVPKTISPSGSQDLIADLNAELQSFYRGSTSGTNADVIVKNLVVNNLRKGTDDVFKNIGEGTFKDLKSQYGNLKKMEDDVVHRAIFESQKGKGLADLTDIISAGDIALGATMNPAFLARGATQFFTKEVVKELTSKGELIRQMFLYGKEISKKGTETLEAAAKLGNKG